MGCQKNNDHNKLSIIKEECKEIYIKNLMIAH